MYVRMLQKLISGAATVCRVKGMLFQFFIYDIYRESFKELFVLTDKHIS